MIGALAVSVVGALALAGTVVGIVAAISGAIYTRRRDHRADAREPADLRLGSWDVSAIRPEKRAFDLRFTVSNTGRRSAVMDGLIVEVIASRPSPTVRTTQTLAPINVSQHRVELHPGARRYDVRRRAFGPDMPPLSFPGGETEAFVITLASIRQ